MKTREKSNYTKLFGVTRRMELPLANTKKAAGGTGLKRNNKSLVLNILSGRCLLDTQVDLPSRLFHMWV